MKERFYSINNLLPMPLDAFHCCRCWFQCLVFCKKIQLELHSIWVSRCQISHVLACYQCFRTKKWGKVSFQPLLKNSILTFCTQFFSYSLDAIERFSLCQVRHENIHSYVSAFYGFIYVECVPEGSKDWKLLNLLVILKIFMKLKLTWQGYFCE